MDIFDPFFTPEDHTTTTTTTTTTTPTTTTTSIYSSQQDLLDIFGFSPSPTSPPQTSSSDPSGREEPFSGGGGVGGGGGGEVLDFFGLMGATDQASSEPQPAGGEGLNPDPFGLAPFGDDFQKTDKESLSPCFSDDFKSASNDLSRQTESGLQPKPQFDQSLDAFFGDLGQKTAPEANTKQEMSAEFQDLFFNDVNPKPDPQVEMKEERERADFLVSGDGKQKITQRSDLENPALCDEPTDSMLTGDHNTEQEESVTSKWMASEELDPQPAGGEGLNPDPFGLAPFGDDFQKTYQESLHRHHIQDSSVETGDPYVRQITDFNEAFPSDLSPQTFDSAENSETAKTVEDPSALMTQTTLHAVSVNPTAQIASDLNMERATTPAAVPMTVQNISDNKDTQQSKDIQASKTSGEKGDESRFSAETTDSQGMAWTDPPEDNPLPWIDGSKEMPAGNSVRGEKFSIGIKNRTDDIRDEDPPSFSMTGDTEIRDQGWMESPASQKVHGHDDELVSGDFLRNADRNTLLPETETPRPRNKEESDLKKTGDGEIALPTQGNREDGEFEKGRGHDRQRTSEDGDDDREPTTARRQDARLLTAGSGEERRQPATEGGGGDGRPTTEEDILQSTEDRHDGMLQTAEDKEEDRWLTAENKEEDRWLTAENKEEDRWLTAKDKEEDRWLTAEDKEEDRWLTAEDKEDIWLTAKDKEEDRSLTAGDEQNGRREALDADDVRDKAWSPLQPASELVKPFEAEPQRHLFSRPGDTTLADTFGGATTQTGFGKSAVEIECTMDAKGETPGGPSSFSDLLGDFDDIPTPTTTQRPTRGLAAEDSGEASDDLRLDDFLGVAEVEGNEPSRGVGRTHSTSSIGRRHKKLRKKKQASPVIVVDGVDEEEGPLKEGGGGDGGGEEEEEEDMEWRKKSGSLKEENKKEDGIDTEMDFAVLEVVSSHLNLEVSKQKTSLRKRGSLARRKRPTRNTVTLPAASDSIYMDSTVTSPAEPDFSDDDDLEKQTTAECSGDATETKKKFSPKKPPMIVPGLHDLTQSKLFKQERKKTAEEFPPATSLTGLSSADSRPWHSTGNLQESHLSTPTTCTAPPDTSPDPGSTPENGALPTPERKQQYKSPVWLSEMKAKTSSPGESGTAQNHASGEAGSLTSSSSTSAGEKSSQRTESFRREGLRTHGATPQVTVKKREQPEAEKPVWMRTAQEKTSRMAGQLQGHREGDENRAKIDDDDQRTAPPWEAELNKRKKLSLVVTGQTPPANNQKERDETPPKQPTASRERDVYTPSWMKSGGQLNITITPSSRNAGNVQTTNSSASDVRGTPGNPMVANEIPRWKTELAEKRRRQGEKASSSDKESVTSGRSPGGDSHSSTPADGSSPSSGSLPAWRQQLKPRRKPHSPDREKRSGEGGGGPDWVKQAEERRARLFKSGLLDQKANESHC